MEDPVHRVFSVREIVGSSATMRVKAMKLFDWAIGRLVLPVLRPAPPTDTVIDTARVRRILVIRAGGVGDAVLLVSFVRAVHAAFPGATIDLLAEVRNAEILSSLGAVVDRIYRYDYGFVLGFGRFVARGYDVVFDTEQWHYVSAVLARASRAPVRVGFDTNPWRRRCYTILVPYRHDEFEGDAFLKMLSVVIGRPVTVDWSRPFLDVPDVQRRWARDHLPPRPFVAVALRGSIRERCWEPEKFHALLPRLLSEGVDVCLLGGAGDRALARGLCAAVGSDRIVDLTGATWLQTAAVLRRCQVCIGPDSGHLHLAYGVGTPVVGLLGASIESKWIPPGGRHRIVNRRLACSPCTRFGYTPPCPIDVRCLREISAEEVLEAAIAILRQ